MQDPDIIQTIFSVAVLIFSVVAHEVSHGYMAQYLGDPTARLAGRLTMNPLKHLDPIGSFVAPLFSMFFLGGMIIGWAKAVQLNPYNLRDQKWGDAKVALAGPLTNLGIAFVFAMLLRFGGAFFTDAMLMMIHLIVMINIILALFNLVPIPPLDGSKVLMSILPYRFRYIGDYLERYSIAFILFFAFFLWKYFFPLIALVYWLFVGVPL